MNPLSHFSILAAAWSLAFLPPFATAAEKVVPAKSSGEVIARVGDLDVGVDEIRVVLDGLDERERETVAKDPALLNQVVRSMLIQRLVLKQAIAEKWDQKPEVEAQVERVKRSAVTESYLRANAEKSGANPTEDELKQAYEAAKESLFVPKQYQLAQIFISAPQSAGKESDAKAKVKLETVTKSLAHAGADFAAIARLNSDEPESSAKGGEIGWLLEKQIQPEIMARIGGLAKGATTPPLRLTGGWHIVKVLDFKEGYTPSFDDMRETFAQKIRTERVKASSQAYLSKLVQENPIVINELALSKLAAPSKP